MRERVMPTTTRSRTIPAAPGANEPTADFAPDFADMLIARTRTILWISLVAGLTFTTLEVIFAPRLAGPFVVKCFGLTVITTALCTLRGLRAARHALPLSLATIFVAYALTALSGMASPSREYDTTAVLFVGGALTTATLLPWGLWPQIVTVAWGGAWLCAAVAWSEGDLYSVVQDPDAAVIIALGISLVTAREVQRYRVASVRELGARRRAEIEVRALNAELERRVAQRTEALRAANEQLHALSARLESVREEERTRISREIHDELGQMLTALKIDIDTLPQRLAGADVAHGLWQRLSAMSDLTETMINSVRRISAELRPSVLDDLGLHEAIAWQAREFERRCAVPCSFTCELKNVALTPVLSTALFRIAQEALTNVARHAEATRVSIVLSSDDGDVVLDVTDDGRGLTEADVHNPKSLGLLGMRERARLLGGDVAVQGIVGHGTTVRVRIPLSEPRHTLTEIAAVESS